MGIDPVHPANLILKDWERQRGLSEAVRRYTFVFRILLQLNFSTSFGKLLLKVFCFVLR